MFLYADPAEAGKFGYVDGWAPGGDVFLYTGEGSEGDQQLQQGNLSLLEHRKQGRALRLFIAASGKQRGGKLHRYVGEFEVDHDSPCAQEDAPDALGETRSVWVFRLRPVGAVEYRESDASRRDVVEAGPRAELVAVERVVAVESDRKATPGGKARRREAELTEQYRAWLEAQGHQVMQWKLTLPGQVAALRTDLFDATVSEIYEAKGSIARESIRMAIGQLLDYRRHVPVPGAALAVLLPARPSDDLVDLVTSAGMSCVYRQDAGRFHRVGPTTAS